MPVFTADQLREIGSRIFEAAGASREEAEIVANHLVTANLYGHDSHGVLRIRQYVRLIRTMRGEDDHIHMNSPGIRPRAQFTVLRETVTTAALDANWGFGQVMARRAMEMAVEKARANDIGLVSIRNCNHIGRVGEYPEIAAENEMVGIAMCNGGGEVSPYGSIDPIYGTCPISIAIPTGGRPILLDMATSVVAGGKIALAIANNEEIPLGWIIDSKGHPTSDPYDLGTSRPAFAEKPSKAKGALLPFGSYKGSGIGLFVEIMGGVLAGAGTGEEGRGNGVVMMAIDIGKFSPIEEFKGKIDRLIRMVKGSRKASGVEEILVAGEPEYKNMERRLREGIYVDDATWRSIKKTAQEFNVSYSS